MFAPIYETLAMDPVVVALLGDPLRVFSFGETEGPADQPYVVHQEVSGQPENFLGDIADLDNHSIQIDVYSPDRTLSKQVAKAVRDALEKVAYTVSGAATSREPDTRLFRVSFDVSLFVQH